MGVHWHIENHKSRQFMISCVEWGWLLSHSDWTHNATKVKFRCLWRYHIFSYIGTCRTALTATQLPASYHVNCVQKSPDLNPIQHLWDELFEDAGLNKFAANLTISRARTHIWLKHRGQLKGQGRCQHHKYVKYWKATNYKTTEFIRWFLINS